MAESAAVPVDGALGEAKPDRVPSYWYDDESYLYEYQYRGPERAFEFTEKLLAVKKKLKEGKKGFKEGKKRILLEAFAENKRRHEQAFTETESSGGSVDDDHPDDAGGDDHLSKKHDEFDEDGCTKFRLVDDWDSEDDTRFDRADFDREYIIYIAASNPKKYEDQFLFHYLAVCKSRGYEFNTVPPPKDMCWPVTEWLKPLPEDKYKEIEPVLKYQAFPVIKEKSGKDLELEDVMAVNVWNRMPGGFYGGGRFYYITFRAKDKNNGSKSAVYQTRLVLDPIDLFLSSRLIARVGEPGPVHAFRLKPNQTD